MALANLEGSTLGVGLDSIQGQSGLFNILSGARSKHYVGVEGGVPTGKEAALDLVVLGKAGLANALHGERILLERSSQRVLTSAGVVLVQGLTASQTGAGDSMAKRLGLGLRGRGSDEGGLSLGGAGGGGQQANLFTHRASEVLEGLLHIRGVVVGFVGILLTASRRERFCVKVSARRQRLCDVAVLSPSMDALTSH